MRERKPPFKLLSRLVSFRDGVDSYTWKYLGRSSKKDGGFVELSSDSGYDNRKLRINLRSVEVVWVNTFNISKMHIYHIGWLDPFYNHNVVYWGLGILKGSKRGK